MTGHKTKFHTEQQILRHLHFQFSLNVFTEFSEISNKNIYDQNLQTLV